MRPDFGTNIIHYIFDNNDDLLAELIRSDVFSAVGRYEPRVILTDVQVVRSDETVDVTLLYVVTFTGAAASVGVSFTG
jgi:phage baseplate assembly protein W